MSEALIQENWKPKANKWLITAAVMLATFIDALNTSIANVALKDMAGSFSITQDESLWIITSFLVSCSVLLPATAWFCKVLGRKKFFLICVALFGVASFICGSAPNIEIMLLGRVLQGIGGGCLFPLSQAILFETFPKEQHGLAMSVFGIGVIFAPIIGPILGGYLTTTYSWNWVFFISIPFVIFAFILIQTFIEDPPYMRAQGMQKIDIIGFVLLIIWLGSFQVMLDNGQKNSWFASPKICYLGLTSLVSFSVLIWWELVNKEPLFDLKIFKNWNFTIGTTVYTVIFAILYGALAILPLFLQSLLGYTSFLSGLAAGPMGVGSISGVIVTAILANKVDMRKQAICGILCLITACLMFSTLNLEIAIINVIIPNILFGFGLSLNINPITTLIFSHVSPADMTNASGLQNLLKNVGSALGTSMVGVMISRYSQIHQNYLVDNLTPLNPVYAEKLSQLTSAFAQNMNIVVAQQKAQYFIYANMIKQSALCAYMDAYKTYALVSILLIPFILMIKKVVYKK